MDPLDAQIRQVAFDTPDLTLNADGVVVRARRVQGKPGDSIVKLRPVDPRRFPAMRGSPGFGVEVDAMPGGFVCSGTMKAELEDAKAKETMTGGGRSASCSTRSSAISSRRVPSEVALGDLEMLGPINVLKLKFTPADFARRLVAELWTYPDGSRILELSTKCAPGEAFEVAAETKAYLAGHGIDLGAEQQTKTRTALEFFSKELKAAGDVGA